MVQHQQAIAEGGWTGDWSGKREATLTGRTDTDLTD